FVRHSPKQNDLGMPGLRIKSSGHSNCFRYSRVTAQIVLSRPRHLAGSDKVRFVKILEDDCHLGIVQQLRIGSSNRFLQLREGCSFRVHRPKVFQDYKAIRLHRDGLVVLRGEGEAEVEYIACGHPVQRTAFPRQGWTPYATRCSGFRGFHRPSVPYGYPWPFCLGDSYHPRLLQRAAGKSKDREGKAASDPPCTRIHSPPRDTPKID